MSNERTARVSISRQDFVVELERQVARMISESGNPAGFDAAAWVDRWINKPNHALGDRRPVELFDDAEGRASVVQLLARAQSGAFS